MNSTCALQCVDESDPVRRAPIEEGDYDFDNDEDEDADDPVNQIDPNPMGDLPKKPHGKTFSSKEEAIQEAIRRVENLQETKSSEDVMPPMWKWEGKTSPEEAEKEFQAEEEFRVMYGKKNKRARKKMWGKGNR